MQNKGNPEELLCRSEIAKTLVAVLMWPACRQAAELGRAKSWRAQVFLESLWSI